MRISQGVLIVVALLSLCNSFAQEIKLNQVGYLPKSVKRAVVPASNKTDFHVIDERGNVVYRGVLGESKFWPYSKENVQLADFSKVKKSGSYMVVVDGVGSSHLFDIREDNYVKITQASAKAYYFNRASTSIPPSYGGYDARKSGHPDNSVLIHKSAADENRPEGTKISSPKGWYDAGDYNKYIVNSGISTYTMLAAYEDFPEMLDTLTWNIPESKNELPDILDEILWNLDWMLTMQDPNDGGVYHKLTTLNFSGHIMPNEADEQRYVVQKATPAALDFAAVMAQASRVFKRFESERPGFSDTCLQASLRAWKWAKQNPLKYYKQPADVTTGEYGDGDAKDEFQWAAAELYITTKADSFYTQIDLANVKSEVPGWPNVGFLSLISLTGHQSQLTDVADLKMINSKYFEIADKIKSQYAKSAYGVTMGQSSSDFQWGSNSVALNHSLILLHAYKLTGKKVYFDAGQANVDYILGQNGTGYCFVTGFGTKRVMNPHHRPSMGDYKNVPVPGFVCGGPNAKQQDNCEGYPSRLPALSYVDSECSYASNEIAINWNAPLFYSVAAMHSFSKEETKTVKTKSKKKKRK